MRVPIATTKTAAVSPTISALRAAVDELREDVAAEIGRAEDEAFAERAVRGDATVRAKQDLESDHGSRSGPRTARPG